MIIAHKFLDVLLGHRSAERRLYVVPHESSEHTRQYLDALVEGIQVAEKFDFGQLTLERVETGKFALPDLTAAEYEAWREGLLPLPAPVCWYEFILGAIRTGLLVVATDSDLMSVTRLDWVDPVLVTGIWVSIRRSEAESIFHLIMHGNASLRSQPGMSNTLREQDGPMVPMALYLTLMIGSKTTQIMREPAPERLNRARMQRGATPLPAHRVVRIVPEQYLRERRAEAGFTRLPPRMHWRRSHVRTLHRATPEERRVLIPRVLVARAADAHVSHEYRLVSAVV